MLSSIPGELLIAIVESLQRCRDINALARIDRRLYGIFNPSVYSFDAETPQKALQWAVNRGQDGTAIKALEAGAKISLDTLIDAIRAGNISTLKILLEADDSDVHSEDAHGRTPFAVACSEGQTDIVEFFLRTYNVDIELRDNCGMTPFSWACLRGKLPVVMALLETGKVDVESRDDGGQTPLMKAARSGCADIVKRLVAIDDVDLNSADAFDGRTLLIAIQYGHKKAVEVLLDSKVDVKLRNFWEHTPLGVAIQHSHPDIVKLLLRTEKADLLNVNAHKQTALAAVASMRSFGAKDGVLELLLERGIPPDATDIKDRTALLSAAKDDNVYAVKVLLDSGRVDYHRRDKNNRTLLELAVFHGARNVVSELLKNDIYRHGSGSNLILTAARKGYSDTLHMLLKQTDLDANATDDVGRTALHRAAHYGRIDMIGILLDSGKADADLRDDKGCTPFATAIGCKNYERYLMVRAFLIRNIHINVNSKRNHGGMTPFAEACENNDVAMVKWLLQNYPVDVNARFLRGSTPLIRAVRFNRSEIIALLLKAKGVDVNALDRDGRTSLAWAVSSGNLELVRFLLSREDIDVEMGDSHGRTPLARAVERGVKSIFEMLLDTGRVDPAAADRGGLTPMSRALKCRHFVFVEMMTKYRNSERNQKIQCRM